MDQSSNIIAKAIDSSLAIIEQEREQEIISRRYGLTGQKETLEQIGEMLGITRERVRQLEKAISIRLKITAEEGEINGLQAAEKLIIRNLIEMGKTAKVSDLTDKIYQKKSTKKEQAKLSFVAEISANLNLTHESDNHYSAISIADYTNEQSLIKKINEIIDVIKKNKAPLSLEELDQKLDYEHPNYIKAVASISKQLSNLGNLWGLSKWPSVNPKNIRDKIYVILENKKQPMHFSDIAMAIKESDFKRKNVTVQAIHNELIKDPRFVLIGRGIYALSSWGYKKGTVADTIKDILTKSDQPLSREEIVKQVLKLRKVKETTILLNLQNKKQFTKVDKNNFTLTKN